MLAAGRSLICVPPRHVQPDCSELVVGAGSLTVCTRHAQAGSGDWLTPVADGLQTVLVFIQSGLEQVRGRILPLPMLRSMLCLLSLLLLCTTARPTSDAEIALRSYTYHIRTAGLSLRSPRWSSWQHTL